MIKNSNNKIVNMVLHLLGQESINEIELFINESIQRSFISFDSYSSLDIFFSDYLENFTRTHTIEDMLLIRTYTGYEFSNINAILRNNWNYEINGNLSYEKSLELKKIILSLTSIINGLQNLPSNIKTYRGVSLVAFKDYGITSLEDLISLKGQYLYESGFTSTSLLRERSFFDRDLEFHEHCNVEIEYLIPEEVSEVLPLITDDLSYSKVQSELLINQGSLSKVLDVSINSDKTKAYIKVILVPRKIYEKEDLKQKNSIKT